MEAKDFVGWTVTVHENDDLCPMGVFYCVNVCPDVLQLAGHGETRDPNPDFVKGVNWWVRPGYCTRLRQGDFAP